MRFRKIPVVIDALLFKTNNEADDKNMNEIVKWVNQGKSSNERHAWHNGTSIFIQTLEGTMAANVGDWIIQGIQGEHYPCRGDIFEKTYELAE
jgi:hypothetical protein